MYPIDQITLHFSATAIIAMNIILGIVMFGIALDMKISDFQAVRRFPKSVVVGLVCQFFVLPAFTFLLILLLRPVPSMAMGMLLVAACPGGNISNFLTHFAKGNTALSVCMSAISTICAIFMTPANFAFWGSMHPEIATILQDISLSPIDVGITILMILGIPLSLGLYVSHSFPKYASYLKKKMTYFSLIVFASFVIIALYNNWAVFTEYVGSVFFIVLLHNAVALATGYSSAKLLSVSKYDQKAITIEVGIQNSALGLTLIFTFFQGLGGMAIVACWWGIWHIIAGVTISFFWSRDTT